MSVGDIEDMTPVELHYALQEANQINEFHFKTTYEAMRLQTMVLFNPHAKHPYKDPMKFMPFPWDKEKQEWKNPAEVQKQSVEEMKAVMMSIASTTNKKSKK